MNCTQGEYETITKFKERFEAKLRAYNAALGPTNQVSDERSAMVFLDNLHRTPYGQFYTNEINTINADATKVPKSVGDINQKAKAYVVIATTTKPNGNPVSFATTADSFLRSNRKENPRGNNKNRVNSPQNTPSNNGLYVPNGPTIIQMAPRSPRKRLIHRRLILQRLHPPRTRVTVRANRGT